MTVQQTLPRRYIDREKLANFWRTNDDFKDKPCGIIVKADSYVIQVPRQMTEDEIKSVYYEEAALEQMEANAAME